MAAALLPALIAGGASIGGSAIGAGSQKGAPTAMATPTHSTGAPSFAAPVTAQSVAPQGSITSGLANKQISPQILALLQKLNQGSGSA